MHRVLSLAGCVVLFAMVAGCCKTEAPDTREADVKAVKALEASMGEAQKAKDVEKLVGFYADDAALMLPNAPAITGKENIRAVMATVANDPNYAFTFQATRAEASRGGDIAYTVGTYSFTMTNPQDQQPITDKGKYASVFRKQADGSFKIVVDILNSDLPPPAAAKP